MRCRSCGSETVAGRLYCAECGSSQGHFVGRRAEVEALNGGLADATAGRGRLLLLAGEAGIGKTRLAEELANEAQRRGARVLWGRCIEGEAAPAFWPWLQLVRTFLRTCDDAAVVSALGSGAADIAHLVPEIRERVLGRPPPRVIDPEQARFQLFESVATFLRNASATTPLVVVLEDLHWADKPSLLLLQLVAGELIDARVLLLGTYRDTDVRRQHPLAETLGQLAQDPSTERIVLRGLGEPDVARLIELIADEQPSASLVAAIRQQTEGNPFFIRELVMLLAADGRLPSGDLRTWSLAVPQGVREVVGRRLNGLSPTCNRLLSVASVIGREFDLRILGAIGEAAKDELLEPLDEALGARVLVEQRSVGRYAFAHALIRETLYEELPSVRRVQLHRRVADALETAYALDLEAHLAELAHHFCAAARIGGEVGKAIDYATRAGAHAAEQLAYEEAAGHYARALDLLQLEEPIDPGHTAELTLALGDAQMKAGEAAAGRATFRRAAMLARRLGSPERLARAALGLGAGLQEAPGWSDTVTPPRTSIGRTRHDTLAGHQAQSFWGYGAGVVDDELVSLLEESLAVLDKRDSTLQTRALARLAVALYWSPSAARRGPIGALAAEAVAMARRLGDPTLELMALVSQHWADWRPDNVDERRAAAREIVRLAAQVGNRELAILGHAFLFADVLEVGDLAAADSALESFARLAEELRQPRYLWVLTMFRAMRALLAGRFVEGEQLAGEALAIGQRTQASDTAQAVGVPLIIIRRDCGGLEELVAASKVLAEEYRAVRTWQYAIAFLEAEVGQEESARRRFDALATHAFTDVVQDLTWLTTTAVAAETAALLADRARAAGLYDLLLPYADRCVVIGYGLACWGSVSRYLGLLATTLGRWADAERHFTTALKVNERLGARPLVARTQYDLARLLVARGAAGDHERAARLIARVLATAHDLGMGRLEDGVRRLEAALTGDGTGVAAPLPSARDAQPSGEPSPENVFHLEGDFWTVRYAGILSRLKDAKGLHYIAQLLRYPGQEFHVSDLLTVITPEAGAEPEPTRPAALGHAGEVLDPQAKAEYRRRTEELRAELDQATDWGDQGRAARLREEIEALTRELASAYGLGGRARKAADRVERVRKAVTGRVRDSIARIQKESPALALHLTNAVRLGTFCAYTPDRPTLWTF
jgi:hypothetical protein